MKKRTLLMVSTAIILVVSLGGYAFAKSTDGGVLNNNREKSETEESKYRQNGDYCGNNEEMIQVMSENGFEDMAQWMEEGNYEAINEFMEKLSDEDYEKMIDLMNENGYSNMSKMMQSIGREGVINVHNSMMDGNSSWFNMMGTY